MYILGTAGHVDHGKSSLIAALTGTHPDRLKAEIAREMTIELGFASMTLPNNEEIGIIDVPGHRDFIGNMLAGIGGIDAVLLVVAADEGVSAQTREHLAIIDLLEIKRGIVVLTKTDLISDPDWLQMVVMDIRDILKPTSLADAPIIPVSSRNGSGLPELIEEIQETLKTIPNRKDLGKPRLPVDRVFTLTGFGTVVTGTLLDGSFKVGDEIVCLPSGKNGRIRGLQNHHHKLQKIEPGYRAAINIVNLNYQDIQRGDVIAHPGDYQTSQLLDAHFRLLKDSPFPIKHNMEVKLFIAASETTAKLRLLGEQVLNPGEDAFIQLRTASPIVASKGDRFILRLPSPSETLGGGIILDPDPNQIYKRFKEDNLQRLDNIFAGNEKELLSQILENLKVSTLANLVQKSALSSEEAKAIIEEMLENGEAISLGKSKDFNKVDFVSQEYWQWLKENTTHLLADFHQQNPYKAGMLREELRAKLKLSQSLFDQIIDKLAEEENLAQKKNLLWLPKHRITFSDEDERKIALLMAEFSRSPFTPPDLKQIQDLVGSEILEGLTTTGRLVPVSDAVIFSSEAIEEMKNWIRETIQEKGSLSLAEFRDHFQTSRKFAQASLEYFDSIGITYRKGDVRALR
ncbi:MAG: selenocysteine-specific translation elongation factor [Anaerolineaceae bacterium]|nr:selenocysteine-specific translation elongation factor [Anaerolineaceae bacterium]